jgi:hypothetical protein
VIARTDVSEDPAASIIMVEDHKGKRIVWNAAVFITHYRASILVRVRTFLPTSHKHIYSTRMYLNNECSILRRDTVKFGKYDVMSYKTAVLIFTFVRNSNPMRLKYVCI